MLFSLKNGMKLPAIGLGTHGLKGEEAIPLFKTAIDLGYQLFDTATSYQNHGALAKALQKKRDKIYICTKINANDLKNQSVAACCRYILKELNTSYINILLLHAPFDGYLEYLPALIELKKDRTVRSIGVSNFSIKHFNMLGEETLNHIDINQIECHPFFNIPSLHQFCRQNHIHLMAYTPFARGLIKKDETLKRISSMTGKSPQQITLQWLIQQGITVIPKGSRKQHLRENLASLSFSLTSTQMQAIHSLNRSVSVFPRLQALFDDCVPTPMALV